MITVGFTHPLSRANSSPYAQPGVASHPNTTRKLIQNPQTDADLFVNELYEKQMIDEGGWLQEGVKLPQMPSLKSKGRERLDFILEKVIKLKAFEQTKDLKCKDFFLKLDLKNGRVHFVGGIVLWILGSEGLYAAGSELLGKKRLGTIYKKNSLSQFDQRKGDVDARYVENAPKEEKAGDPKPNDQKKGNTDASNVENVLKEGKIGDPKKIAEELLKSLAKEFQSTRDTEELFCDELRKKGGPFKKFHPFFDLDAGNLDRHAFLVNHDNGEDFELDLMISAFLKSETLLTMQDLILDITDYLTGESDELVPSGKTFQGWQAIVAILGKLIQFQSLTPQAWARAESKKIFLFRSLAPYPPELYAKMKPRAISTILHGIASGHINKNPTAACMLLLDCASDLLHKGFHPIDVDQMTQTIKINGNLPYGLQLVRNARESLSMELILAVMRISRDRATSESKGILSIGQEECECTIQMDSQKAIEVLISYEMGIRASKSLNCKQALLNLLGDLVSNETVAKDLPIALQVVKNKYPQHIEAACQTYFKNREGDAWVAFTLVQFLSEIHFKKAVQLFGIHLNHAKKIGSNHLDLFEKIIPQTLRSNDKHDIEFVNHLVSMAHAITKKMPESRLKVIKVIESVVEYFLQTKRPKMGAYLLKLGAQSKLTSQRQELWLLCAEGVFGQNTGLMDAVKFWAFAERHGVWTKPHCPEEQTNFFMQFIRALYYQNTPECFKLGDALLEWLPAAEYKGDYSEKIVQLRQLRVNKALEYEASQMKLDSIFECLSKWSSAQEADQNAIARQTFLELIAIVAAGDPRSWQASFNKINQLVPKIRPLFDKDAHVLYESIMSLIESGFDCGFHSSALMELLELTIRELPGHPRMAKLIMRGIKEERIDNSSAQFKESLKKANVAVLEILLKQDMIPDIILLINYVIMIGDISMETNHYFAYYLEPVVKFLEHCKTEDIYNSSVRECLLNLHRLIPGGMNSAQSEIIARCVDGLHRHRLGTDSAKWMKAYLESQDWKQNGMPFTVAMKLMKWTETIARQERYEECIDFLEYLHMNVPAMQSKIFELIMDLPASFLNVRPLLAAKAAMAETSRLEFHRESYHVSAKIRQLLGILMDPPYRQEHFSYALDFIESGFDNSIESQSKVMERTDFFPPNLKFRTWKLFRLHLQAFLSENEELKTKEPVVLKCARICWTTLRNFPVNMGDEVVHEIDKSLEFYMTNEEKIEHWTLDQFKRLNLLNDIESLLASRLQFLVPEESNPEILKKIVLFRKLLIEKEGISKKILEALYHFDGKLAQHLMNQKEPELFMEGIRIFRQWVEGTKENTPHMVDLIVLGVKNSPPLTGLDYLEFWRLMHEVCVYFWNRKYSKNDEQRVNVALLEISDAKKETNLSPQQIEALRETRIKTGRATQEDLKIQQEKVQMIGTPHSPYIHVGPVIINKMFLNKVLKIAAIVCLLGALIYYLRQDSRPASP